MGKTILLTSNYLDELKILCDAVYKLENGKLSRYEMAEQAAIIRLFLSYWQISPNQRLKFKKLYLRP